MAQDFTEQNRSLTLGKGINADFTLNQYNSASPLCHALLLLVAFADD